MYTPGIIFGAIFTYAIKEDKPKEYHLLSDKCEVTTVASGDLVIIQGAQDRDQKYFCTVRGKVYQNEAGNDIQESVKTFKVVTMSFLHINYIPALV